MKLLEQDPDTLRHIDVDIANRLRVLRIDLYNPNNEIELCFSFMDLREMFFRSRSLLATVSPGSLPKRSAQNQLACLFGNLSGHDPPGGLLSNHPPVEAD